MIDLKASGVPHLGNIQDADRDHTIPIQTSLVIFAACGLAGLSMGAVTVNQLPTGSQTGATTAFISGPAQQWSSSSAGPCLRPTYADQGSQTKATLVQVRSTMGLNITQLARVLRVERPTVYAWLKGDEPNQMNSDRLCEIAKISRFWQSDGPTPGRSVLNRRTSAGETILDALSAATLDYKTIEVALNSSHATPQRLNASERAKRLGLSKSSQANKNRDDFVAPGSADDLGANQ